MVGDPPTHFIVHIFLHDLIQDIQYRLSVVDMEETEKEHYLNYLRHLLMVAAYTPILEHAQVLTEEDNSQIVKSTDEAIEYFHKFKQEIK